MTPPLYIDPDDPAQAVELVRPVPELSGVVIVRPAGTTDTARALLMSSARLLQLLELAHHDHDPAR